MMLPLFGYAKTEGLDGKLLSLYEQLQLLNQKLKTLKEKLVSLKKKLRFPEHPSSSIWSAEKDYGKCLRAHKIQAFINDCSKYKHFNKLIPLRKENDGICRIATFNVHYWTNPNETKNFDNIIESINSIQVDILILQEVNWGKSSFFQFNKDFLEAKFKNLGYQELHFCEAEKIYGAPFGNAILSKYPLVSGDGAYLSLVQYNMTYRGEDRCYVGAALQLPNGKTIDVYATHLDVFDDSGETRLNQIKKLVGDINQRGNRKNILIGADFNENREKDYQYQVDGKLVWNLLVDEHEARGINPVPVAVSQHLENSGFKDSFSYEQIPAPKFTVWTGTVVDFLYLKNWNLEIDGCYVLYNAASDHLPVIMDIKI